MTRPQKKQLDNNKIAKMIIGSFSANGTSDIVTPELVTAATADGVTVIPSNGSESSLGFIVTSSTNKVDIVNSVTKAHIGDINGDEIFGRLTEAAGVYTLSYFSIQSGVETAVSLNQIINFLPSYNFALKDFPFDSAIRLDNATFSVVAMAQQFLSISSNTTINKHFDIIEGSAASGKIKLRLGDLTSGSIIKNKLIVIKRIDETINDFIITGTDRNFEEDDDFTPLSQTVSSPASGNTLTANVDVSNDLAVGDTIRVANGDIFTVANISGTLITTNETITISYSADTLDIGGFFLEGLETLFIYGSNADIWRSA